MMEKFGLGWLGRSLFRLSMRKVWHGCHGGSCWCCSATDRMCGSFRRGTGFRDGIRITAPMESPEIDAIVIGAPNDLHCEITEIRGPGWEARHLREAALHLAGRGGPDDRGLQGCRVLLSTRKSCCSLQIRERKKLVDDGALGQVYLIKQSEKHSGPTRPGSGTSPGPAAAR